MLPEPWINRDVPATKCCVKTKQCGWKAKRGERGANREGEREADGEPGGVMMWKRHSSDRSGRT